MVEAGPLPKQNPKKHAPDLIRGVQRFSEKIMLKQEARAG